MQRMCLMAYITDNRMDFTVIAGIYWRQFTDQPFNGHTAAGEYIPRISVRHLNSKAKRNLRNLARLQGAVIGHIHIRAGVVPMRTEGAVVFRYAKVNQLDLHAPPPSRSAG